MNSETDSQTDPEPNVQTLQACLFPTQLTASNSYFSNFFVKPIAFDEDDESSRYRVKETGSFRDTCVNRDAPFTLQQPRWPTECQVLEERVQHISYIPSTCEPYYQITGNEVQPKPSGEECGVIVYQYSPISAVNYFSRSSLGGSRYLLSTDMCPEEDSLKFESRFECGNLATAIRITPSYYELHLRADMYTNRHMQWFYFRVTNMRKGFKYRFSITNCSKENSLYNEGMKPLMYSTKDSQLHSIGWRRIGQNITYFCNDNVSPDDPDQQMTYTLSFTLEFPHDDDEVYLANCYPYSYSDLQDYLMELSSHPIKSTFSTVRLLCKSLAGNNIYFVTITSPLLPGDTRKKKAMVITARVHPGETPASWMVKGCLDFLTGDSGAAKELRDRFVFKVVPMLNPDGVIVGNSRCSLSAKDLNRQYRTVMRDAYPSIWYTKLMVRRLLEECGVAMYCDLHAHSRKHNIFVYGCENRRCGERKLQEQVFPLMLHKNTADKFSFESCKFRIQKAKEGTGRVVMWMMGIANSYTMEASLAGSSIGNRIETHFTIQDYEQMGKSFCQTLLDYYDEDPRKERLRTKIIERLTKEGSNADEPTNIPLSDYSSDEGDTSSLTDHEEEKEIPQVVVPCPPPPSPVVIIKKAKVKATTQTAKAKLVLTKASSAPRKPLPICKATLKLSLSEKENLESSSDSEREFEKFTIEDMEKVSLFRRKRRKKKKGSRKKCQKPIQEYSDSEVIVRKSLTQRSISVFDLIPTDDIGTELLLAQSSRTPPRPSRIANGRKSEVTRQLTEVQAKLYTLKNKLWFGVANGDMPISWVSESIFTSRTTTQKVSRKVSKKDEKRQAKTEKHSNKETKLTSNNENKTQNGLKRQSAIDWSISVEPLKLGRSRSLPDDTSIKKNIPKKTNKDEKQEKKKKKRSRRFAKKAKVISNAKTFTQKV